MQYVKQCFYFNFNELQDENFIHKIVQMSRENV